ncbi:MAG: hypothetical protein WCI80_04630 [Bacteroidota bacterium]|jgi:hypothetical protein
MKKRIVFIEFGAQEKFVNQIKYSVMTLKAFNALEKSEIVIYSEDPSKYKNLDVSSRSIKEKVSEYSLKGQYLFRIKPCVLLDALNEHNCPILFVDTDTFCKKSLSKKIMSISQENVLMNAFESTNPYPDFSMMNIKTPSGLNYSYDPKRTKMYNSGIIGVNPDHKLAIQDAIYLIDEMKNQGLKSHTAEQTALSEAFRIHHIKITELKKEITHYTRGTGKDYMNYMIQKELQTLPADSPYPEKKFIKFNWLRPRLHKHLRKLKINV